MAMPVNPVSSSAQKIKFSTQTATTTATALSVSSADVYVQELLVTADPDNTVDLFVGDSASQPLQLTPGQSVSFLVPNIGQIYIKTASGTAVCNFAYRV